MINNNRISTILVSIFSMLYALTLLLLIHLYAKIDVYFQDHSGQQIHNFFIVSQIARVITSILILKCFNRLPEVNYENRNYLLPYIIWTAIDVFVNIVIIAYIFTTKIVNSTVIILVCILIIGTLMSMLFVGLMASYYRYLLKPMRTRGQSRVAFLDQEKKRRESEKDNGGLIMYG
uniref:Uncharacterized protein n=1 Tax=Clytia hemisphaerica TaxID=252671 RepID=A0A7M5V168_9CNID|eukprot:TCONS_00007774-protein